MTVTRKKVNIISKTKPDIKLLLINSLGPPCAPQNTFSPIIGKMAFNVAVAIMAPIICEIIYPIPSAIPIFLVIIIGIVTAGLI